MGTEDAVTTGAEQPEAVDMSRMPEPAPPDPREATDPEEARRLLDAMRWQDMRPLAKASGITARNPQTRKFWKRAALTNELISKWFPVSREPERVPEEAASEPDAGVPTYLQPPDVPVDIAGAGIVAALPDVEEPREGVGEPEEDAPVAAPVAAAPTPAPKPKPRAYADDDEESWHTDGPTEYIFVWSRGLAGRLVLRQGQPEVRDSGGRVAQSHIPEICAGFGVHGNFPPGIYRTFVERRAQAIMRSAPFRKGQIVERAALDRACLAAQVADGKIAEARLTGKPIPDRERLIAALGGRQDRAVRDDAGAALVGVGDPPLIRGAITTAHKGVTLETVRTAPDRPAVVTGEGTYEPYAPEEHGGMLRPDETAWVGPPLQ